MILQEVQGEIWRCHMQDAQTTMDDAMAAASTLDARKLLWGTKMGEWLTMLISMLNGTDIGDKEWHDDLFLHYRIEPLEFPTHCDGCTAKFSIQW